MRFKIFISSVQSEFAGERKRLVEEETFTVTLWRKTGGMTITEAQKRITK